MSVESVSILVPTHNRAAVLDMTLDSLAQLQIPAGVEVEAIVAGSACTDDTPKVVASRQSAFPYPLRYVEVPVAGANRARNRCLSEARGEILAFLDDDVKVAPQWLSGMLSVYRNYPAAIVSGPVDVWWHTVEPPAWFTPTEAYLLNYLNLSDQVIEVGDGEHSYGCNMSFRRSVPEAVGGFLEHIGRCGRGLMGGDETEFLVRAVRAGNRVFYSPEMRIGHLVLPHRIETSFLCRLGYGEGKSRMLIKQPFGMRQSLRSTLGNIYLMCKYGLLEIGSTLGVKPSRRIPFRIKRYEAQGRFVGALHRIWQVVFGSRQAIASDGLPPAGP